VATVPTNPRYLRDAPRPTDRRTYRSNFADDFSSHGVPLYPHIAVRSRRVAVESLYKRGGNLRLSDPTPHNLPGQPRSGFGGLALIARARRNINRFRSTCLLALALASRSWKARDRSQSTSRWNHDTDAAIPLPSRACSRLSSYVQNMG
jgi:hypothetical protein